MAYKISKTNKEELIILNDGVVDTAVTSLNLIGKNVSNFGDAQNENFVHLLENFAYNYEPSSALQGQLWFDTTDRVMRPAVYDGSNWRPLAVLNYSISPTDKLVNAAGKDFAASRPGDFWFDSVNEQLHVVTSGTTSATSLVLVGPEKVIGLTSENKLKSLKIYDGNGVGYPVIEMVVDDEVLGIISNTSFTPATGSVPGFPKVYRGLTFKNYNSSTLYTTSTADVQLYGLHEQLNPTFVRRNAEEHILSNWHFDNNTSLFFGTGSQSSVTWTPSLDSLTLTSTGKIKLQSPTTALTFDGLELVASNNTVDLGSNTTRFKNLYIDSVISNAITATTMNTVVLATTTATATDVIASTIAVSTLTSTLVNANTVTSNTVNVATRLTAPTISNSTLTSVNIATTAFTATTATIRTLSITTISGVTITADTFNGLHFKGGIYEGTQFILNGYDVVTTDTIANLNLNADRLLGAGSTGYVPASQGITGNSIAQRTVAGGLQATTVETTNLTALGGLSGSQGYITGNWVLNAGSKLQATYADLAEHYEADAEYTPGTVLEFGGAKEVTVAEDSTRRVAGVVSTNPAYVMNGDQTGEFVVALALTGRVPCKVRGHVRKGDMMVSAGNGFARAEFNPILGSIIGKAIEDFNGIEGVIEVVVGRL